MGSINKYFDLDAINNNIQPYERSNSEYLNDYKDAYQNRDESFVLNSYKTFFERGLVEVISPVDGTSSVAVNSFCGGTRHFLLMQSENGHYWILTQCMSFIECIIYNNTIYYFTYKKMAEVALNVLGQAIDFFEKTAPSPELKGLFLHHNRPFHSFYDQLKSAINLKSVIEESVLNRYHLYLRDPFVSLDSIVNNVIRVTHINKEVHGSGVTLKPLVYSQFYTNAKQSSWTRESMNKMESILYNSSNAVQINTKGYDLVLWIGVTGQKRSWEEQIEGYTSIIKHLQLTFKKLLVIVDGWTATIGEIQSVSSDNDVYFKIANECSEVADFISLIGQDYDTKISVCKYVDFFLTNAGTGSMVPMRICKKDGVLHSNKTLFTFPDNYTDRGQIIRLINKNFVVVDDDKGKFEALVSYSINWKFLYNLLITVINEKRGTSIEPLTIQERDLNEHNIIPFESAIKVSNELMNICLSSESEYIDIVRDLALILERKGKLNSAIALMSEARTLRPNGEFIEKKLNEWKNAI